MDSGAQNYKIYVSGDDNGIIGIVKEFRLSLMNFISGYVRDMQVAEDLTEELFLKLMVKKPRYNGSASFKTWLYTIARNISIDYLRKQKRDIVYSIEDVNLDWIDKNEVEKKIISGERTDLVRQTIEKLNYTYQQLILLKYYEEFSNEQIAEILHKSRHAVETGLYRARLELKVIMEKEGVNNEE